MVMVPILASYLAGFVYFHPYLLAQVRRTLLMVHNIAASHYDGHELTYGSVCAYLLNGRASDENVCDRVSTSNHAIVVHNITMRRPCKWTRQSPVCAPGYLARRQL